MERRADGFVQRGRCRPRGLVTEGEGPGADAALPSLNPSPSYLIFRSNVWKGRNSSDMSSALRSRFRGPSA